MLQGIIGCTYYAFIDKKWTMNNNQACWNGLNVWLPMKNCPKYIYITAYDNEHTRKYQKLLISIINKITPCSFLTRQGVKYIEFKLIEGPYNKNVLVLNFIRNLWSNPAFFENKDYTSSFFESIINSKEKDPMKILTKANIFDMKFSPGHSNANPKCKIKSLEEFNESKWNHETKHFLTT